MLDAVVVSLVAGAISVTPANACPAAEAITDEIARLGANAALAQVGTAEVKSGDGELHIAIRDRQGIVLGSRAVEAPADCTARAALAAVLIAAWTGDWIKTNLGGATPVSTDGVATPAEPHAMLAPTASAHSSAAPPSAEPVIAAPPATMSSAGAVAMPLVAPTPAPEPSKAIPSSLAPRAGVVVASLPTQAGPASPLLHVELAALGFGLHDGDAGTFGAGAEGTLLRRSFLLVALVEGAGERQRALDTGQAGYSFVRMGLGLGVRKAWQHVFVDFSLVPELARYALRGIGLNQTNSLVAWGLLGDGRARLGLRFGRVAPFAYVGASWSLLQERLRLDDPQASITLSRANVAAGLGISFTVR